MATHSRILAWRIPWTEEPGGLRPMGLQRAGHDSVTKTPGEELKKGQALRRVAAPSSPGKEFPPPRAHAAPRPRPILLRKEADFAGE